MPHRSDLHQYQNRTVKHILEHPQSMLFLDLGMGKTIAVLTALTELFDAGVSKGALIVAPLRVAQTVWKQEAENWDHTKFLTTALIHGKNNKTRAATQHKHIYLINYEALPWLVNYWEVHYLARGKALPVDTIVLDEITKLKSTRDMRTGDEEGSTRGKALLRILPYMPRRIGLTATPAPNGLVDLFGQFLLIDDGRRLGRHFLGFKDRFFDRGGYNGSKATATKLGKEMIHKLIADITIEMKGSDYLELPEIVENVVNVVMPPALRKKYDKLELEMWMELDSGSSIEAVNTLSLMSKLVQFSNGAIYKIPEQPEWERIHDLKLDALAELYEANGEKPMLVSYQYKHDKERILKRFKKIRVVALDSKVKQREMEEIIIRWNKGEIDMLLGHAGSIGHGLNLQYGSHHVVFFGLSYNLELYLQFIGRLERQGQENSHVFVHKILCEDTLDQVIDDALHVKEATQNDLRKSLKTYRARRNM